MIYIYSRPGTCISIISAVSVHLQPASASGIFWRLLGWGCRLMELDNASIIERIVQQRPQVSVPLDLNLVRGC